MFKANPTPCDLRSANKLLPNDWHAQEHIDENGEDDLCDNILCLANQSKSSTKISCQKLPAPDVVDEPTQAAHQSAPAHRAQMFS